jgi:hypothetical protein
MCEQRLLRAVSAWAAVEMLYVTTHRTFTADELLRLPEAGLSDAHVVFRSPDPLRLPRLCVPGNDGGTLARWLGWWLAR